MILTQTTLLHRNGKPKYIGQVNEKGEYHGKGKEYCGNRDFLYRYEGDFVNGKYHGKGKLYLEDGITLAYEGEFKDGEPVIKSTSNF